MNEQPDGLAVQLAAIEQRLACLNGAAAAPAALDCPFCFSAIPIKASRCPQCTSEVKAA
jgi:large conductance mechanosensitive channel